MPNLTLGLDLGANSIGWAVIDEENRRIVDAGVRVFPEGVDNFDTKKEKAKNESRRVARGMRRQIARRARRKRELRKALIAAGLFPADAAEQERLLELDPYLLRRRALREPLTPHEVGRVFIHLNQRRGFLSNRKSDRERKKEVRGMLAEINDLAKEIETSGDETLGAFFANRRSDPHTRIRGKHTLRAMYEHEFDLIWERQRNHHAGLLTDDRKAVIRKWIFHQRDMYWPKSVVGRCELEPREKRSPKADRLFQRFRMLQEVNNLKYIDPGSHDELPLPPESRTLLLDKLSQKDEMTFDDIRKTLGFIESIGFNLERGKRTKLKGMPTDKMLADKKIFGPVWHKRPDEEKNAIVRLLLDGNDDEIQRAATERWGLSTEAAERLLELEFPPGYAHLGRTALAKLLPHMERGLLYMTHDNTPSALSEAGYLRRDQLHRVVRENLAQPPDVTNPVVRQALFEVRKVVNAIVREYGKPARIHLELARNAKASADERRQIGEKMRDREAERDSAAEFIREHNCAVTRAAIDQVLLWREQGEKCVYTGRMISPAQLLAGEAVTVDHILPYSRCLDDSFGNKVVCFRDANDEKGNQMPYEWLAERDPKRYERMLQSVADLPYAKRRRFSQKELDLDKFIQRQLNDTRYISRAVLEYVRTLCQEPHHALCVKGEHTAILRRHWGLNAVLRHDELDLKNREDHRHHAVDAIVIALTNASRLQQLADLKRRGGTEKTGELIIEPWPDLRAQVEQRVNAINVSHRPHRKVAGALHEDTIYSPTHEPGVFVVRKSLESLTPSMVEDIRDEGIKRIIAERLQKHGIKVGRKAGGSIPKEVWRDALTMPSGVPIKRVRIKKRDLTIQPIRESTAHVKPGSVHHVTLFEAPDSDGRPRRLAEYVTMLEAMRRIRDREPLIRHAHSTHPDATFVMSLSPGDMLLAMFQGRERLVVVTTLVSTQERIHIVDANDARRSSEQKNEGKTPNSLTARKVTVDPLGRIRWAND